MDNASAILLTYVIGYLIAFLIGALITRAIFSIPTIVYNIKVQTVLLERIAQKQGVTLDELDGIRRANG